MSRERLIVTAVTVRGLSQAEAARAYGLSQSRVSRILARWRREGDAGLVPRSRRPKTSPTAIPAATVELIVNLRANLQQQGLDHGPATIIWHLTIDLYATTNPSETQRVEPENQVRPFADVLRHHNCCGDRI